MTERRRTVRCEEIQARIEELAKLIETLEAKDAPCNEPMIRQLKARMRELEGLLAGDAQWRSKMRKRRVVEAIGDFGKKGRKK